MESLVCKTRCSAGEALQLNRNAVLRKQRARSSRPRMERAELVFDNMFALTAGSRSGAGSARQLLYRSGRVCIDMHIQPKLGSLSAILTGQLLDSKRPNHILRDVPVSLVSEGGAVSHKKTNEVGEFDFGIEALKNLQLVFGIGKRKMVVVAVPATHFEPVLQP
jgi:hypothetical protein